MKEIALELQPCCWDRSGIGTYTYELARRLHSQEELRFHGNVFNFLGRRDNSAALSGITMPIYQNNTMPYGVYRRIWNFVPIPYQWLFKGKADLSIFFNFIVPPNIKGHVITVVHDLTYLRYPETMKKSNLEHMRKGIAYSIARSDKIITVSQFSKKEIQEQLGVPEEKISIVYNAPSLAKKSMEYSLVQKKYGINQDYILFVSTIEPRKNIKRLLRAFDYVKKEYKLPHQLVLAGGKGWQDEAIYETAAQLEFSEDIVFTGYISAEEKNTLYQNASVFVFPSVYEGFGIPPLEAMAMGCPVVCTDVASLPEVAGDAAHFVDPFDEKSIAEGIIRVLFDREYADCLVKKGYAQCKKFTWDNSAQQLLRVCQEVLS